MLNLWGNARDLTRRLEAGAELAQLQARRALLKQEAEEVSRLLCLIATSVLHGKLTVSLVSEKTPQGFSSEPKIFV